MNPTDKLPGKNPKPAIDGRRDRRRRIRDAIAPAKLPGKNPAKPKPPAKAKKE